jgi:formylglycine-generating enzyme required for sulfatase activity
MSNQWLNGYDFEDFAVMSNQWLTTDPDVPDDMVYIPDGEFEMGDHFAEGSSNELPLHQVLVNAFFMSRYEITNQQYCDYLNDANSLGLIEVRSGVVYASLGGTDPYCDTYSADDDSQIDHNDVSGVFSVRLKDGRDMSDDPMVEVSWYGAAAYCNWRSNEEGKEICYNSNDPNWPCDFSKHGYRLATEAEWEYAARGGNHSPYYRYAWGDSIDGSMANYWLSGDPYETGDDSRTTPVGYYDGNQIPVGSDMANGYGLYDMTGNVWEWCNDWYDGNYYDVSPYDNPTGPASGSYRVFRSGGWISDAHYCRVANRGSSLTPDFRSYYSGFRIVLDLIGALATVPDVVDTTQASAEAAIIAAGLVVGDVTTSYDPVIAAGNVISQDPTAGFSVLPGTSVDLVVSLGAEPTKVGYWRMDDNELNTTVIDSSGNGNNGTAQENTSVLHVTSIMDGALTFDGVGDYIQIADSASLSPTQEITVCGWFYFDDASENVGLIWKDSYNYALYTSSDKVRFFVWNALSEGSQASFSTSLLESGWNFIAGVFDGANSRLYLNGAQIGSIGASITGGIRDRTGDLYIGQRPDGAGEQYFDGEIDDVRIFNTTLSEIQIQAIYGEVSDNPVGRWAMDDYADNTVVSDSSGNDNNGTAQKNTEDISDTGKIDGTLTFDGIGDYVQIADSDALSPSDEVTVCGWFYFNDASENVGLIWKHNYNYVLYTYSNSVYFIVWSPTDGPSQASFSTSLLESGWNFIAGAFDGTNSRLYLNGVPSGSIGASITGGIRDRAGDLYIGQRPDGAGQQYFDGLIDEVKIYGKALSVSEVENLYNEGGI